MSRINIEELKKHVSPHIPTLVAAHLPNAKKVSGGWRIGDLDGNKGASTFISEEGVFFDHSTGDGGGLFQLLEFFGNCSGFLETAKWAAAQTGYTIPEAPERRAALPRPEVLPGLNPDGLAYLASRGFDAEFVETLPIKSLAREGNLAIIHNNETGKQCQAIRYYDFNNKAWSSSPNPSNVLWPLDYVVREFVDWTDYLVVCEGHWDAIAYLQAGIPAVSIPSGATNDKWIEECFDFLCSFQTVVLSYDADDVGIEATCRVAARIAAAIKPPRVIEHPAGCKDANDVLKAHGTEGLQEEVENAQAYAPPEIIAATSIIRQAIDAATDMPYQQDTPFHGFKFNYRAHETTLYTGYTGHGKSNILEQSIGYISDKYDVKACIASFEDQPDRLTAKLMVRQFGRAGLTDSPRIRQFLDRISIYNTKGGDSKINNPQKIIDLFIHLHLRWGVTHFVIDNLMTLSVGREDYEGIVSTAELFRQLVNTYPVHLHLVAHPRKPPSGGAHKAPDPYDVRGPAEVADLSFNILSILRNIPKERQMEQLRRANSSPEAIATYDRETPDAELVCHKQRFNGFLPSIQLWFQPERGIFVTHR